MDIVVRYVNVKYIKDVWTRPSATASGLRWLALEKTLLKINKG